MAYSQRSRSSSGTRWLGLSTASRLLSRMDVFSACWAGATTVWVTHLDRRQAHPVLPTFAGHPLLRRSYICLRALRSMSRPPLSERDPARWDLWLRFDAGVEAVAAEEAEDAQRAAAALPPVERPRDLLGFKGFANGGAEPRQRLYGCHPLICGEACSVASALEPQWLGVLAARRFETRILSRGQ